MNSFRRPRASLGKISAVKCLSLLLAIGLIAQTSGDRVLSIENKTHHHVIFSIVPREKSELLAVGPLSHREVGRLAGGANYGVRITIRDTLGNPIFETGVPIRMTCSAQQFQTVVVSATATSFLVKETGCAPAKF